MFITIQIRYCAYVACAAMMIFSAVPYQDSCIFPISTQALKTEHDLNSVALKDFHAESFLCLINIFIPNFSDILMKL